MSTIIPQISFGFDIVITCLLAATIFFAVKLSRHLDSFRSNRADMENLIRELSNQITRAQEGISVLDELSASRGDELRSTITKAQALSDELQLMTESADSLASRLETLAVRNREIVTEMDQKTLDRVYPVGKPFSSEPAPTLTATRTPKYEETLTKAKAEKTSDSIFSIRDPDYEDDLDNVQDDFSSQAERDLAEALKRRGPKGK
jgi:DNA repair exonuclease SbcCD ATPase subunit